MSAITSGRRLLGIGAPIKLVAVSCKRPRDEEFRCALENYIAGYRKHHAKTSELLADPGRSPRDEVSLPPRPVQRSVATG